MGDYGNNLPQAGDVYHFMGANGGEVREVGGYLDMTTGIESLVIDLLFGGNDDDDGSKATELNQWCGNEGEPEEYRARGRFQSLCNGQPITSAKIPKLEKAAVDDIMQAPKSVIKDVSVSVYTSGPKRVDVEIQITGADGTIYDFELKDIDI